MLGYEAGIFTRATFLNLCVSTMMSVVACCLLSIFLDDIFVALRPWVSQFLDQPSRRERRRLAQVACVLLARC